MRGCRQPSIQDERVIFIYIFGSPDLPALRYDKPLIRRESTSRLRYAPPQECSESGRRQFLCVRRLVLLYILPRSSPLGQLSGLLTKHMRTRSPLRNSSIAGNRVVGHLITAIGEAHGAAGASDGLTGRAVGQPRLDQFDGGDDAGADARRQRARRDRRRGHDQNSGKRRGATGHLDLLEKQAAMGQAIARRECALASVIAPARISTGGRSPIDRRLAARAKIGVRPGEMPAAEEATRRQRRGVRQLQHKMFSPVDIGALAARVIARSRNTSPSRSSLSARTAASVNCSQPLFWCEPAAPSRTVSVALSSSTPCRAQRDRSGSRETGWPRSASISLKIFCSEGGGATPDSTAKHSPFAWPAP